MASIVEAAGYSADRQYEALLMHWTWTVPYMGVAPPFHDKSKDWTSLLQLDGTPIEYSWKWNSVQGKPDVRYSVEPIGKYAGTSLDPLNQQATRELLHRMSKVVPDTDMSWAEHFMATLFDHDASKYAKEAAGGGAHMTTSLLVAIELLHSGPSFKTYFQPRKLGQVGLMPTAVWDKSIRQLDESNAARTALLDFLGGNEAGKLLKPFCLSVDNVDPSRARLKWYFNSPHTSLASVREMMTLGGRIHTPHMERQLDDLFALLRAVADLPADFAHDKDMPTAADRDLAASVRANFVELPEMLSGNLYFFDVAPGKALPEVKFYTPVRNFGRDDLALARALGGWMESRGRGAYVDGFVSMLHDIADHRHLGEGSGVQTFLSCQFKATGELDITSYLAPEAYHPKRMENSRATLKRDDFY